MRRACLACRVVKELSAGRIVVLLLLGTLVGCIGSGAAAKATQSSQLDEVHHIQVGGLDRTYRLFVPPDPGNSPLPLVFLFHGGGQNSRRAADFSEFHAYAGQRGAIVVYPDGTPQLGLFKKGQDWNVGSIPPQTPAEKKGIDDLGFVRALVKKLESEYKIDPRRIYATGVSLGAIFTYNVACHMSDTFAAVAIVAGALATANCNPDSPVAILVIHGIHDRHVTISGERGKYTAKFTTWPPVSKGLNFWRERNGCSSDRKEDLKEPQATCWLYGPCSTNRPVEYCEIDGGHEWPGQPRTLLWQRLTGVKMSKGFSANRQIWAFFVANPKK